MKKIISILLTASMVIAILPTVGFSVKAATEGDYEYEINSDEESVTIIGYNGNDSDITIPSELGGLPVTEIGSQAFRFNTIATSITIPGGVTGIRFSAFGDCTSLVSITIPDSVASIGDAAFVGCTSLTTITIPDGITNIGYWTFMNCESLAAITIPDSVTDIGHNAFSGCNSLISITIPAGVTSIDFDAFNNCTSLASLQFLGSTPPSMGNFAFNNAPLSVVHIPTGSKAAYEAVEFLDVFEFIEIEFCEHKINLTECTICIHKTTCTLHICDICGKTCVLHICDECDPPRVCTDPDCEICNPPVAFVLGRVLGNPTVAVADAVHIFMYLAKMKSSIINIDTTGRAYKAACITGDKPSVADAVQIFMFLAKMPSSKVPK